MNLAPQKMKRTRYGLPQSKRKTSLSHTHTLSLKLCLSNLFLAHTHTLSNSVSLTPLSLTHTHTVLPEALWDLVSLGMTICSASSRSLSDLESSSDQGFLFFTFLPEEPLGVGVFFSRGVPVREHTLLHSCGVVPQVY